jgi:hypothetical protein
VGRFYFLARPPLLRRFVLVRLGDAAITSHAAITPKSFFLFRRTPPVYRGDEAASPTYAYLTMPPAHLFAC